MKLKSLILPALLVLIVGAYIVYRQFSASPTPAPIVNNNQNDIPVLTPVTQTGYKNGQYAGSVASSVYGDTQVQVTILGGKITNIRMLQTPTKPGHTAELVASSYPILKSEAIASQSANVNIVSGATQNSEAFSQSLAVALSQAS